MAGKLSGASYTRQRPLPTGWPGPTDLRANLTSRLGGVPEGGLKDFYTNLLRAQLDALEGSPRDARRHLEAARATHPGRIEQRFGDFVSAGLMCGQFEWAAHEFTNKYGLTKPIHIGIIEEAEPSIPVIRWQLSDTGASTFACNLCLWMPRFHSGFVRFAWIFPLIAEFLRGEVPSGWTYVNLGDVGRLPGLAFCDNKPNCLLIPDPSFISTVAYVLNR